MALPAKREDGTPEVSNVDDAILRAVAKGIPLDQIPRRLSRGNKNLYQKLRRRVQQMWLEDHVQQEAAIRAKHMAIAGTLGSMPALIRRAQRGRVDAIKFLAEFSGIHNPRVEHKHSGDIHLSFAVMPRPELASGGTPVDDEPVVDATVVED